jgi:hypothetical protein
MREPRTREQANVRPALLALVFFLLGLGVGAFWYYRAARHGTGDGGGAGAGGLSEGTRAVLKRLDAPIDLRFYSLLDPASASDSLQAFAERVDQLLAEYEREAGGKIQLTRCNSRSDAAANAASADGLRPFGMDKGDACYLGIAVVQNDHKESLPQLAAEWEPALESDLTRAIERVINAKAPATSVGETAPIDPAAAEEVKRAVPNFASVSVEEATRVLREQSLKAFQTAAKGMELQVKQAEQRLAQAENANSEAEQQAAMKQLQQVQAEQAEKLKQIAARSQAQIAALEKLKGAERQPAGRK